MTSTTPAAAALPQPLLFGQRACAGWLHGATGAGLPVLLCGPVGAEDLSAHRLLWQAAERLAAGGQPCLRFDLAGCGDSAPLRPGDDAVPHWLASVHAAIDALRAATGAPAVALLGLRLGATLAALAAQSRDDVAALLAWVPVTAGRALLREWKLLGAAGLPSLAHPDGSLETGGFHVNAATCAGLGRLSLTAPPVARPAPRVLVLDRDDLPVADAWCTAMRSAGGAAVTHLRLSGHDGLMAVPHLVRLPQTMLAQALQWLRGLDAPPRRGPRALAAASPGLRLSLHGRGIVEQRHWLPGGSAHEPALCAVTDMPQDGAPGPLAGTAILVPNTGAERHIGPHGQFVAPARRWAAAGATVLRLDLAGLGDSPERTGEPARVYSPQALADLQRALAWLRAQPGVRRVMVLGLCSGAFHAFEALAQGLAVERAVAINPLLFFRPEREDFAAAPVAPHAVQQLGGEAWRHLRDPARWRKLLRGQADVAFLAQLVWRRAALALARTARALTGRGRRDGLAAKLRRAAGHPTAGEGARLCFVFAERDAGLALLQAEAGRMLRMLQRRGRVEVHRLPEADHTFSRAEARARLHRLLDGLVGLAEPQPLAAPAPARPPEAALTVH